MTIGNLSGDSAQLADSLDSLRAAWAETATRWDDSTSRRFHKECMEPVEPITRKALAAIQRLADVLESAERECSDR